MAHAQMIAAPSDVKDISCEQENAQKIITAKTNYFEISISSKGATVTSFKLKTGRQVLEFVTQQPHLMMMYMTPKSAWGLRTARFRLIKSADTQGSAIVATARCVADTDIGKLPIRINKFFFFHKNDLAWHFKWQLVNGNEQPLNFKELYFSPLADFNHAPRLSTEIVYDPYRSSFYMSDELRAFTPQNSNPFTWWKSRPTQEYADANVSFFGYASDFTIALIKPGFKSKGVYVFRKINSAPAKPIPLSQLQLSIKPFTVAAKGRVQFDFDFIIGPKSYRAISQRTKRFDMNLEELRSALAPSYVVADEMNFLWDLVARWF